MIKAILLGTGAGILFLLLDYLTYVKLFPPPLLFKMSAGLRILVIYGNVIIEILIISFVRGQYLALPDMQDKSLGDHVCWGLMTLFFAVPKFFIVVKAAKLPISMWRK